MLNSRAVGVWLTDCAPVDAGDRFMWRDIDGWNCDLEKEIGGGQVYSVSIGEVTDWLRPRIVKYLAFVAAQKWAGIDP